jgi:hypothetical protein
MSANLTSWPGTVLGVVPLSRQEGRAKFQEHAMTKITVTLAALLLAGGVAFAQSYGSGTSNSAGATGTSSSSMNKSGSTASANKLTGCKTTASKEEKGKQGAVANSSSHNAATTGSRAANGSAKTGC